MAEYTGEKGLIQELKGIRGKARKYLLLRISGIDDIEAALNMISATRGAYINWFKPAFSAVNSRLNELRDNYKEDAIKMLRRDTQVEAVLLEADIIKRLQKEISSGKYDLVRTNIARDIFGKLLSEIDMQPKGDTINWIDKIQVLQGKAQQKQLEGGDVIDTEFEAIGSQQAEYQES